MSASPETVTMPSHIDAPTSTSSSITKELLVDYLLSSSKSNKGEDKSILRELLVDYLRPPTSITQKDGYAALKIKAANAATQSVDPEEESDKIRSHPVDVDAMNQLPAFRKLAQHSKAEEERMRKIREAELRAVQEENAMKETKARTSAGASNSAMKELFFDYLFSSSNPGSGDANEDRKVVDEKFQAVLKAADDETLAKMAVLKLADEEAKKKLEPSPAVPTEKGNVSGNLTRMDSNLAKDLLVDYFFPPKASDSDSADSGLMKDLLVEYFFPPKTGSTDTADSGLVKDLLVDYLFPKSK